MYIFKKRADYGVPVIIIHCMLYVYTCAKKRMLVIQVFKKRKSTFKSSRAQFGHRHGNTSKVNPNYLKYCVIKHTL